MRLLDSSYNWYRESGELKKLKAKGDLDPQLSWALERVASRFDQANKQAQFQACDDGSYEIDFYPGKIFGFFLSFTCPEDRVWINLGTKSELPWWGTEAVYRLDLRLKDEQGQDHSAFLELNNLEYLCDDSLLEVADILLPDQAKAYPQGEQAVFIQIKLDSECKEERLYVHAYLYKQNSYEDERLIETQLIKLNNLKFPYYEYMSRTIDSFFLDLWQHPCSWARAHELAYWSDEHFELIEHYLSQMAKLGQKVLTICVSDMPWAGQACFEVEKNPSRLYEYNCVRLERRSGKLKLNTEVLERYINLGCELGICQEIDLIGLLCNWHPEEFGNPLSDYPDAIRLKVWDYDTQSYAYLHKKSELREYLSLLFAALEPYLRSDQVRILSDQPLDPKSLKASQEFLQSCTEYPLRFKYAINQKSVLNDKELVLENSSASLVLVPDLIAKDFLRTKDFTWYSCCYPQEFNFFLKSPLIEARMAGPFTKLWGLKGMLRWSYACYHDKPRSEARYKSFKWAAGDMNLVYPGNKGQVLHSLRECNLRYGIEDFNLLSAYDNKEQPSYLQELSHSLKLEPEELMDNPYYPQAKVCNMQLKMARSEASSANLELPSLNDWQKSLRNVLFL